MPLHIRFKLNFIYMNSNKTIKLADRRASLGEHHFLICPPSITAKRSLQPDAPTYQIQTQLMLRAQNRGTRRRWWSMALIVVSCYLQNDIISYHGGAMRPENYKILLASWCILLLLLNLAHNYAQHCYLTSIIASEIHQLNISGRNLNDIKKKLGISLGSGHSRVVLTSNFGSRDPGSIPVRITTGTFPPIRRSNPDEPLAHHDLSCDRRKRS